MLQVGTNELFYEVKNWKFVKTVLQTCNTILCSCSNHVKSMFLSNGWALRACLDHVVSGQWSAVKLVSIQILLIRKI